MTDKEPKAQTADLTAQCSYSKGSKRLEEGSAGSVANESLAA